MRARPLICKLGNAFLRGLLQGQNSQLTSLSVNRHRKLLAQGLTQRWLNNCKTGDFPGGSRREGSPREQQGAAGTHRCRAHRDPHGENGVGHRWKLVQYGNARTQRTLSITAVPEVNVLENN